VPGAWLEDLRVRSFLQSFEQHLGRHYGTLRGRMLDQDILNVLMGGNKSRNVVQERV
jgi:hypothetical protein